MRIACRHSHFSKSPSITRHSGDESYDTQRSSPWDLTLPDHPGGRTVCRTARERKTPAGRSSCPKPPPIDLHQTPGPGSKCPSPARAAGRLHAGRRGSLTAGAGTPGGTGHSTHPTGSYVPMRPSVCPPRTSTRRAVSPINPDAATTSPPYPDPVVPPPQSTPDPSLRKSARGVQETYPVRVSRPGQPVPPAYSGNLRGRDSIIHNLRLLGTTRVMVSDTPASPGDTHTNELTRS